MTTIKELNELLGGGATGRGNAIFLAQKLKREGGSPALRRLCEELIARRPEKVKLPPHPQQRASRERYLRDNDEELSPVELVWLQRLPRDPKDVTFEDAARLAALAGSISTTKAPSSARLVESVWEPVKALHDKRVAEAQLEQTRQPLPSIPDGGLEAVTELLSREHPGVSEGALNFQAQELLAEFQATRQHDHQRAVAASEAAIEAIDQRTTERLSLDGQVA